MNDNSFQKSPNLSNFDAVIGIICMLCLVVATLFLFYRLVASPSEEERIYIIDKNLTSLSIFYDSFRPGLETTSNIHASELVRACRKAPVHVDTMFGSLRAWCKPDVLYYAKLNPITPAGALGLTWKVYVDKKGMYMWRTPHWLSILLLFAVGIAGLSVILGGSKDWATRSDW